DSLPGRTRLGPPGVAVDEFRPRPATAAAAGLRALAARLASAEPADPASSDQTSAFARDDAAAGAALARLDPGRDRLVAFVGKLIVSKGVDLLLAAWPLVVAAEPRARLVMVGFGAYREGAERLVAGLAEGDLGAVRALAERGRAVEGGPPSRLAFLLAFLDRLQADEALRARYLDAGATLTDSVVFTGRLEHPELAQLLPACEAIVVPSTFPEAFGMVAAEAAACGVLPVSAAHSGLAEVSRELARALLAETASLVSFELGPAAVMDLAARVSGWLRAPDGAREQTRAALVRTAAERYSWEGVARGVILAAEGRLDDLSAPV
ncbi:MAG TPA: glycosyltransferase family 4 protein, partial [Solirubrobacteraceae bacterium]